MNIKTINKIILLVCSFLSSLSINAQEIVSPNKNIKVAVSEKASGQVFFKIMYKKDSKYVEVLTYSPLGISRKDQQFVDNLILVKESKAEAYT